MCNCQNSSNGSNNYSNPTAKTNGIKRQLLNSTTDGNKTINIKSVRTKGLLNSSTDGHINWGAISKSRNSFIPCTNNNEFSADPAINDYVIINRESNQNISRNNLAKLPMEYHIPVFRSLSNTNKARIYIEKIQLLIYGEGLSSEEIDHLKSIILFLKPEVYTKEYFPLLDSFVKNWTATANSKFNWNKTRIGMYIGSFLSPTELILQLANNTNNFNNGGGGPIDAPTSSGYASCACSTTSDWCWWFTACNMGGCWSANDIGCGAFGGFNCNGTCKGVFSQINTSNETSSNVVAVF